ncbi:ABC transporter ATP-binding protein [Herbaspirillum sp.]|uniref:ABC transporter ATP-binding protein n=1 Tax=Herbaspirillum sp. TaxID=1890675 RepID=UPI0031D07581
MLRVNGLSAYYGLFQALFGIDLYVQPGETVALIGANGAGKSSLLRAVVGSIKCGRSQIHLDGKAIGGESECNQLARGIALVPEGRKLFPSLSVLENLQVAARNGRAGVWTVERVLRELPVLEQLRHRPATSLSGGQQQLVALSRALVTNPAYLLFDEVSLGLSPLAVNDVYALIGKIKKEGISILLVEQNLRRALAESDRYYCIQKGRISLQGHSAEADHDQVTHAYFGVTDDRMD